jgi:hypothetical protein
VDPGSLLERIGLSGREHLVLETPDGSWALLVEIGPDEVLERWRDARAALADTGRWPIVSCSWSPTTRGTSWADQLREYDIFSRFYFKEADPAADAGPLALIGRAKDLALDSSLDRRAESMGRYWRERTDEWIDYDLGITAERLGALPDATTLRAVAAKAAIDPEREVDRFLYAWEREHGYDTTPPLDYQQWFVPLVPIALVLLPTSRPWEVFAYVSSLYDISAYGGELVVAAARRWHELWGAEPVALWGTMVQFMVSRPPASPDDAWALAREHDIIAANTLSNPGVPLRDHARALLTLDRWFLHSRP